MASAGGWLISPPILTICFDGGTAMVRAITKSSWTPRITTQVSLTALRRSLEIAPCIDNLLNFMVLIQKITHLLALIIIGVAVHFI